MNYNISSRTGVFIKAKKCNGKKLQNYICCEIYGIIHGTYRAVSLKNSQIDFSESDVGFNSMYARSQLGAE